MPIELTQHDDLPTLKLEVGQKWRGVIVDIDEVPHYKFGSTTEVEVTASGRPKSKWVVRLRPKDATDATGDLKWWTQNQVKFALREAIAEHRDNYMGAEIGIERLDDGEPSTKGYKPFHQYRVVVITPGPDGWTDPYTATGVTADDDDWNEEPFVADAGDWLPGMWGTYPRRMLP